MGKFDAAVKAAADAAPMPGTLIPARTPGLALHIDGDYLAYFASGSDECEAGQARWNAVNRIETLRSMCGADRVYLHLTASGSHKGNRYLVATVKPYQEQRSASRRPKNWEFLRGYLEDYQGDAFKVIKWHNREADDGIAYAACKAVAAGKYAVIGTADKDMRMLPGLHINWKTFQLTKVEPEDYRVVGADDLEYGTYWFWKQMLMGDTADHIPGLERYVENGKEKKMGEVTAGKALAGTSNDGEAFHVIKTFYKSYYSKDWADRVAEQASLLWLRRDRSAGLLNFYSVMKSGDPELIEACKRLRTRVEEERATLDRIAGSSSQG